MVVDDEGFVLLCVLILICFLVVMCVVEVRCCDWIFLFFGLWLCLVLVYCFFWVGFGVIDKEEKGLDVLLVGIGMLFLGNVSLLKVGFF